MDYKVKVDDTFDFEVNSEKIQSSDIIRKSDDKYHLIYNNKSYNVEILSLNERNKEVVLSLNGSEFTVKIEDELDQLISEMGLDVLDVEDGQTVYSPMPGLVLSLKVKEGDTVEAGDELIVLEAMKMENVIQAETNGIIENINVTEGEAVDKNQLLMEIDSGE